MVSTIAADVDRWPPVWTSSVLVRSPRPEREAVVGFIQLHSGGFGFDLTGVDVFFFCFVEEFHRSPTHTCRPSDGIGGGTEDDFPRNHFCNMTCVVVKTKEV